MGYILIRNKTPSNGSDIDGPISASTGQFDFRPKNNDLDINGFGISEMYLSVPIELMMKYRYICFQQVMLWSLGIIATAGSSEGIQQSEVLDKC